jgi:hypothetical protein
MKKTSREDELNAIVLSIVQARATGQRDKLDGLISLSAFYLGKPNLAIQTLEDAEMLRIAEFGANVRPLKREPKKIGSTMDSLLERIN